MFTSNERSIRKQAQVDFTRSGWRQFFRLNRSLGTRFLRGFVLRYELAAYLTAHEAAGAELDEGCLEICYENGVYLLLRKMQGVWYITDIFAAEEAVAYVEKEGTQSTFTALSGRLIRYMASNSDYVCMESPSVKNEWKDLVSPREKIIHLYTDVLEKPVFEYKELVIGMVCRLTPGKHVLECIEAMQKIHKEYPEWKLEIIGSGKQQQECEELIEQLKAEQYVNLLGWVEHSDLQRYTRKWKFLLFPTDTEGMPNGLIEMMGCGIPAIASAVGGIADIVTDGINGILLSDCSDKAIFEGIRLAITTSEEAYRRMSANAYETINEQFTLEAAQKAGQAYL